MESTSFSILFILGLSIVGGLVGASLFQKLRIPQVVGFIAIGLVGGELNIDQVPVVAPGDGDVPVGILDRAKVRERVDIEVFRRRQAIEFKRSSHKTERM